MKSFKYGKITIEVEDEAQLAKLEEVLKNPKSISMAAVSKAAPGMMRAIDQEIGTCTARGVQPDKVVVKAGKAKAQLKPDRRANKEGITIGNL